jgi:hypothetical protein
MINVLGNIIQIQDTDSLVEIFAGDQERIGGGYYGYISNVLVYYPGGTIPGYDEQKNNLYPTSDKILVFWSRSSVFTFDFEGGGYINYDGQVDGAGDQVLSLGISGSGGGYDIPIARNWDRLVCVRINSDGLRPSKWKYESDEGWTDFGFSLGGFCTWFSGTFQNVPLLSDWHCQIYSTMSTDMMRTFDYYGFRQIWARADGEIFEIPYEPLASLEVVNGKLWDLEIK